MVGQRPLKPLIEVRILARQQIGNILAQAELEQRAPKGRANQMKFDIFYKRSASKEKSSVWNVER